MEYTKGTRVKISVKGDTRMATIAENGIDSSGKVRVRPDGFPFDMSIQQSEVLN